jgi:transposase
MLDRILKSACAGQPRRTYSLAFKQQVAKETQELGASVSVVARRHDMNATVIF